MRIFSKIERGLSFRLWWVRVLLIGAILLLPGALAAESVRVRYMEGAARAFFVLRTMDGKTLAVGDHIQLIRGDRVRSRTVFRFKDGSVDDETAEFSQRGSFRLLSNHHIQKGPAFPHPTDVLITTSTGEITVRSTDDKGQEKVETHDLDLPPDLANGIVLTILKNIPPDTNEKKISYLAVTPRPRLVKLSIVAQGEESFSVAGARRKAMRFLVRVELGGITGAIAPLLGKQPADTNVWVVNVQAPAFVKFEGPLYMGGPIWSIEPTTPVWQPPPQKRGADPQKK
jgi:hypothetical protein